MLKPNARLCPDRSVRAIISNASGNCEANAFRRRFRRNNNQQSGTAAIIRPTSGMIAGWTESTTANTSPTTPITAEIAANLAIVRLVSACSNSREMLPNRSKNTCTMPGLSSNGCVRMLASFAAAPLPPEALTPVNRSRRSSILLTGLLRNRSAAPPTIAATPTNAATAISNTFNV